MHLPWIPRRPLFKLDWTFLCQFYITALRFSIFNVQALPLFNLDIPMSKKEWMNEWMNNSSAQEDAKFYFLLFLATLRQTCKSILYTIVVTQLKFCISLSCVAWKWCSRSFSSSSLTPERSIQTKQDILIAGSAFLTAALCPSVNSKVSHFFPQDKFVS